MCLINDEYVNPQIVCLLFKSVYLKKTLNSSDKNVKLCSLRMGNENCRLPRFCMLLNLLWNLFAICEGRTLSTALLTDAIVHNVFCGLVGGIIMLHEGFQI